MSNDDLPSGEMLAHFVSGPVPMGAAQDKDETLALHYGESRARLLVLMGICRRVDPATRRAIITKCDEWADTVEEHLPSTSRFTSMDAARRELRSLVAWLVDLD